MPMAGRLSRKGAPVVAADDPRSGSRLTAAGRPLWFRWGPLTRSTSPETGVTGDARCGLRPPASEHRPAVGVFVLGHGRRDGAPWARPAEPAPSPSIPRTVTVPARARSLDGRGPLRPRSGRGKS